MALVDTLLQPDIAYLLLMAGFWLSMMALLAPGTGILELAALIALLLAGWEIFNLPVNWWALVILGFSAVFFVLAVRWSKRRIYLAVSLLCLIAGSAYLFRGEGAMPGVNPALVLVVSVITSGSMWLIATKSLAAQLAKPSHDLASLVGSVGVAKTQVHEDGTVYVNREDWSAVSREPIDAGSKIRVLRRDGFILYVEELKPEA